MQRLKNLSYTYSAPPNFFKDSEVAPNLLNVPMTLYFIYEIITSIYRQNPISGSILTYRRHKNNKRRYINGIF